jgi:hypothetical protein
LKKRPLMRLLKILLFILLRHPLYLDLVF